jgi:hypothetical protein
LSGDFLDTGTYRDGGVVKLDVENRAGRTAAVFLTHERGRRILRHYDRLKREAGIDTFLHFDEPNSRWDCAVRIGEMNRLGRSISSGFTDLAFVPALSSREGFDYVWYVEFDVDFAGAWGDFFALTKESKADFLATTIQTKDGSPDWIHWKWFECPPEVRKTDYRRCFCPIMRCSTRMLATYMREVGSGRWRGHTEALLPTIALHNGLIVEDMHQWGVYTNSPDDPMLSPGTMVWRPHWPRYFHEDPTYFERGRLYHPVKPAPIGRQMVDALRVPTRRVMSTARRILRNAIGTTNSVSA